MHHAVELKGEGKNSQSPRIDALYFFVFSWNFLQKSATLFNSKNYNFMACRSYGLPENVKHICDRNVSCLTRVIEKLRETEKRSWKRKKDQLYYDNLHFNSYDVYLTYFYDLSGFDQLHQQSHELSFISTTKQGIVCTVQSCLLKVSYVAWLLDKRFHWPV